MKTKKLTLTALLTAIALIMFVIEAQIPPLTSIQGVKLGLSNIVTLFAMYTMGPGNAICILLIRIFLGSIFTGQITALIYSLAGGLLCFFLTVLLSRIFPPKLLWVVSIFGAIAHNAGQIAAAVWVTKTPELMLYFPVLIISGVITGLFTGVTCQILLRRLHDLKFVTYYGRWEDCPDRRNRGRSNQEQLHNIQDSN